jgi:hypothetical protein
MVPNAKGRPDPGGSALYGHRNSDDKFFGRIRDLSKDRVIRKRGVDESTHCNSGDQRCDSDASLKRNPVDL